MQVGPAEEVIVVDDGSTDETLTEIRRVAADHPQARILVHPQVNGGAARARNAGVALARGVVVAFLDDDDYWLPGKVSAILAAHEQGAALVCHNEYWEYGDGRRTLHAYDRLLDITLPPLISVYRKNPFSTSALSVARADLARAGTFDTNLRSAEDYDYWLRLVAQLRGPVVMLSEPLSVYSIRPGSESARIDDRLDATLEIGRRFRPLLPLSAIGRWFEWHKFRARAYAAVGVRYAAAGNRVRGMTYLLRGLALWPFRFDLLQQLMERTAR
jgi:glycosyltransferase involved in cell wall biosynthesis